MGYVPKPTDGQLNALPAEALLAAVARVSGVSGDDQCGSAESSKIVAAKEALIAGRLGTTTSILAAMTDLRGGSISRHDTELRRAVGPVIRRSQVAEYYNHRRRESRESRPVTKQFN